MLSTIAKTGRRSDKEGKLMNFRKKKAKYTLQVLGVNQIGIIQLFVKNSANYTQRSLSIDL